MNTLPKVYPDSFTTLPEDRFMIQEHVGHGQVVLCRACWQKVTDVDHGNDLNTLVRLSHAHMSECKGIQS